MATLIARAYGFTAHCFFGYRDNRKGVSNIHHYKKLIRANHFLCRQWISKSGCAALAARELSKEPFTSLELEKVTVIGHVDHYKVLKQVRRSGERAEFWLYTDVPLYFTSIGDYFRDTRNEFKESYNYYKHGYNLGHRHGSIPVSHRGDDNVSNMFNDDNVNAICCLM
ncbi:HEAVY METAL ASSOCIATED PROTEIN 16 [Hibiscus trionum]|uniref:HEAVY METAL ASSOCIATED PROTEIN 16 n=1 Tax=Hibiscus trionum TaxID=183268 RepID=A0A9W7IJL7_HIBTR|nr:HEAVY METAL ASSOCIATED PROTEIN 16 [Hibiscus trionum]